MTEIRTTTGLAVDYLIQVKVLAHNGDGSGDYSEINTSGATIETAPLIMNTITSYSTTNTAITLTWTALTTGASTGGSSVVVTSYEILWD